jgi:hypothetical protein
VCTRDRHAESHPEAGVLYRGFVMRVWEGTHDGCMHAEVFMNFYPKFDNAKQLEHDKMIQVSEPQTVRVRVTLTLTLVKVKLKLQHVDTFAHLLWERHCRFCRCDEA